MRPIAFIIFVALLLPFSCKTEDGEESEASSDETGELASVAVYLGEETDGIEEAKEPTQISGVNLTAAELTLKRVVPLPDGAMSIVEVQKLSMTTKKIVLPVQHSHYHIAIIGGHGIVIPPAAKSDVGQAPFIGIVADRASTATSALFEKIVMDPQGAVLAARRVIDLPALYEVGAILGVAGEKSKDLLQDQIISEFITENVELSAALNQKTLTDDAIAQIYTQAIRQIWSTAAIEADLLAGTYNAIKSSQIVAGEAQKKLQEQLTDATIDLDTTKKIGEAVITKDQSEDQGYQDFAEVFAYAQLLPKLAATTDELSAKKRAIAENLLLKEIRALPIDDVLAIIYDEATTPLLQAFDKDPAAAIADGCSGENSESPECNPEPVLDEDDLTEPGGDDVASDDGSTDDVSDDGGETDGEDDSMDGTEDCPQGGNQFFLESGASSNCDCVESGNPFFLQSDANPEC